jgi:UDP-glucose 4-epimerase
MNSVLVTGSCGFLGGAVARRLAADGQRVVGLDVANAASDGFSAVVDDLSSQSRLEALLLDERITHIIHSGGISGPMVLPTHPERVMAINVGGSLNLVQAALAAKVKTFVYCSSVASVGPYYEDIPIGADQPLRPKNAYSCSKAAVDLILQGIWNQTPLDVCAIRFPAIYGPARKTSIALTEIVIASLEGRPVEVDALGDCPYIFIDDAADATIAACFSDRRTSLYYYAAFPEQVSLKDMTAAVALYANPVSVTINGAHPAIARGPVDIAPAARDFAFSPKIDHREGIRRMIEAFRKTAIAAL